jgi:DNA-binding response OmpR family regulator
MAYLLMIDDDADFSEAAATVLRAAGHEVAIELDTKSGIRSMELRRPDLVILDVMFPEDRSAGFELARAIRHHNEKTRSIPVLMLTAINTKFPLGFSAKDIDNYWLPVADFVEKPVDFEVLKKKVEAVLRGIAPGGST